MKSPTLVFSQADFYNDNSIITTYPSSYNNGNGFVIAASSYGYSGGPRSRVKIKRFSSNGIQVGSVINFGDINEYAGVLGVFSPDGSDFVVVRGTVYGALQKVNSMN